MSRMARAVRVFSGLWAGIRSQLSPIRRQWMCGEQWYRVIESVEVLSGWTARTVAELTSGRCSRMWQWLLSCRPTGPEVSRRQRIGLSRSQMTETTTRANSDYCSDTQWLAFGSVVSVRDLSIQWLVSYVCTDTDAEDSHCLSSGDRWTIRLLMANHCCPEPVITSSQHFISCSDHTFLLGMTLRHTY